MLLHAPLELVRCFDSSEIHGRRDAYSSDPLYNHACIHMYWCLYMKYEYTVCMYSYMSMHMHLSMSTSLVYVYGYL